MDLATRVENRRTALGMTQAELGNKTGLAQTSIHNIERGETKRPRNMELLATALECSQEWLQFGVGELDNASMGPSFKKTIPLVSFVQAGYWDTIQEDAVFSTNLPCPVNCSQYSFALRVQGVSMEPKFFDGDLIYVDPEAITENGSYVVARLDDENQATFKQLVIEGDHKFLKPANPNWPDQLIPINGNCTIVGKVVFTGKEL
jgi:SOS-response transcriptional repressor LexA